jgi:hypothetical protein
MNTKEIENKKRTLKITKRQREIIVGTLLGDGHLESMANGTTYRLKVEHSVTQKDYVDWLYKEFSGWVRTAPRIRTRIMKPPENKIAQSVMSYGFTTYSHGALRFYAQQFYNGKKKQIPKMIKKILTPLSLAVWFMDDGSWKSARHRTFIFHTLGYARQELEVLVCVLKVKFGITAMLHKQKHRYWRLYIASDSAPLLRRYIERYVREIPSMMYKLGNTMPKK